MNRRHNRRVTARPTIRGTWMVRLYRDGRAIARGTLRHSGVTWTALYNVVELGEISERTGRYRFLGYDYSEM